MNTSVRRYWLGVQSYDLIMTLNPFLQQWLCMIANIKRRCGVFLSFFSLTILLCSKLIGLRKGNFSKIYFVFFSISKTSKKIQMTKSSKSQHLCSGCRGFDQNVDTSAADVALLTTAAEVSTFHFLP